MDAKQREELHAARSLREAKLQEEQQAHEDLVLELEDRYSRELGVRGRSFQIANEENACGEGPIVVKPADAASIKRWKMKEGNAPEDAFALASPCVLYPEGPRFIEIQNRRPQLLEATVAAILQLAGVSQKVFQGKF
jgi:hypothetical protein